MSETPAPERTTAETLAAAAFQLRNPFHAPGLKIPVDSDLAVVLANWLDFDADRLAATTHPGWQAGIAAHPLAVACLILGEAA